jgi:hypothetical protein
MTAADTRTAWQAVTGLTEQSLRALLAGEVPAVRIPGFATPEECRRFCEAIRGGAHSGRAAETARMNLIGANFSNHAGKTKAEYFALVDQSYADVGRLCEAAGFNPLERMIDMLKAVWPAHVGVAMEPEFGRYFAGGVKTRTSSGHLHYDFTPHTAPGYVLGNILDQLGWNLYLDMPASTGGTVAYKKPVPREAGAQGRGPARAMNLDRGFVEGAESFAFHPQIGEVAIINTRYPHDIVVENAAPDEWRVQTSSFIGRLPNDDLILWS